MGMGTAGLEMEGGSCDEDMNWKVVLEVDFMIIVRGNGSLVQRRGSVGRLHAYLVG